MKTTLLLIILFIYTIFSFNLNNVVYANSIDDVIIDTSITTAEETPIWYIVRDQNNAMQLFGVGSHKEKDIAIQKAIKNLLEVMVYNVEKITFDKNLLKYNSEYYLNLDNEMYNIYTDVYTIEKFQKAKGKDYILISIKRKDLFDIYYHKFVDINLEIEKRINIINNSNIFIQKDNFELLKILISYAKEYLKILYNINKFNGKDYLKRYEFILNDYSNRTKNIFLTLKINDDKYNCNDEITDYILRVGKAQNIDLVDNSDNILEINFETKQQYTNDKFIVNLNLIFIYKYKDKVIEYKTFNFETNSEKNFKDCYYKIKQQILLKFEQEMLL